jgi:outer membrane protein assembly factor BamB
LQILGIWICDLKSSICNLKSLSHRGMTLHSSHSPSSLPLKKILTSLLTISSLIATAFADGTRTWEQSKFDELTKGTATGVAIRSAGGLELAPAFKLLYATPSTYIWAAAADDAGNVYAATGAPARVYRITPDGKATIIFEPQELQVQALEVGANGMNVVIYAATAPDGKVYKIEHKPGDKAAGEKTNDKSSDKSSDKDTAKPALDKSWSSSVYFAPETKYIWDLALDKSGNLYVATGDHGEIFKVTPKGEHSLFFKSDETHIRVLAIDAQGNVIAGTDGSGLVYRISPSGEGFVLYSAPKKEITALAIDHEGNIYAAGVGEKKAGAGAVSVAGPIFTLPAATPAPAATAPGLTITPAPSAIPTGAFPFPGGGASGGSDVYRIAADGSPLRLWSSHEDIVYALAFDSRGQLLAGTGNRGHVFAISGEDEFSDLLKAPASQITAFAKAPGGGLYAASSNLGKIFVLGPGPENEGTYESDVFDAKIFSRWGRAEFRGTGNVELLARSGNVDNPDRNWSPWKKVDLSNGAEMGVPSARYAQWKAVLHAGSAKPTVDSVTLNYLPKNVAPEIDDVSVQIGTRYQPIAKMPGTSSSIDLNGSGGAHFDSPVPSTHDRDAIGVKWNAHDDNDDQLVYSVYYRGDGDTRWLLLKDNLTDKVYSFDASLLPDGGYTVKVVASDAPSHSPGEALMAEKISHRFEVDTTPPRIENLAASLENGQIHVRFRAEDGFSTIRRAEFSVDAGEWKYVEPVGQISDAKTEDYDFKTPVEAGKDAALEHVVVVRVYDKYDNMGAAKTVLRGK